MDMGSDSNFFDDAVNNSSQEENFDEY